MQITDHFILGNIRRFRRICEHTQSVVSVVRRPPPHSPRAQRKATSKSTSKSSSNADISESSSCNSEMSERVCDKPQPLQGSAYVSTRQGHRQVSKHMTTYERKEILKSFHLLANT